MAAEGAGASPGRGARRKLWHLLGEKALHGAQSEPAGLAAREHPAGHAAAAAAAAAAAEDAAGAGAGALQRGGGAAASQPQLGGGGANEDLVRVSGAHRGHAVELDELVFVQCLREGGEGVNVLEFSPEGMFMATGGRDGAVVIWRVLQHDKELYEQTEPQPPCEAAGNTSGDPIGPKLFSSDPWQVLRKHTKEVTALSWSRSQFLLSGSADATVRLWHVQRDQCLYVFRHRNPVTSVSFSPQSDLCFASSAEDRYVRVWNIEKGEAKYSHNFTSGVQTISFLSDASMLLVGTDDGEVHFLYVREDCLEFHTQIECRNRRGIQRKGKPVVGLQQCSLRGPAGSKLAMQDAILVSTQDSRLRLCSMDSYACLCKFKGASLTALDIKARINEANSHVISASEDKCIYVWNLLDQEPDNAPAAALANSKKLLGAVVKKCNACESFQGHSVMVTQADFVPERALRVARKRGPLSSKDASLRGCIIVSADINGHIHVFENHALSQHAEEQAGL